MKRRELKRKAESRSIFSMFPAKKKGDMVKSASSIVDVVTPVEIFERNQKCLASCDIGLCVKSVKNMKDKEIIDLVNNVWKPLTDYDFPKTTYNGIKVSCKFSWLSKYKWLVYSESLDALFCLQGNNNYYYYLVSYFVIEKIRLIQDFVLKVLDFGGPPVPN